MNDLALPTMTRIREGAFSLDVPAVWDLARRPTEELVVVACEPVRADGGFRANATVVVGPVGDLAFDSWQRGCDELLGRTLHDWLLIDLERTAVDGHEAVRRTGHHRVDVAALTMEQVAVLVPRPGAAMGLTLTVTVETGAYDSLADTISAMVTGFRVPREGS